MVWVSAARFTVAKRIWWRWIRALSSRSQPTEGWSRTPVEFWLAGSDWRSWVLR